MSIDRWDPFREMMTIRDAMDRWLHSSISGTGQLISTLRPDSVPVDVLDVGTEHPLVAEEFTFDSYTTVITPTGQSLTLFIRGHSKWQRVSEANFNLDNLSLRGVPGAAMPVTGRDEINWVPIVALIVLLLILFREAWRGVAGRPEEV